MTPIIVAKPANLRNTLVGFTHENGFRVFSFDRLGDDRVRTRCTVRADLALIRAYGIQIQELPLLCRGLLDRCEEGREIQSLTFTEGDMRDCATERAAVRETAAKKRKSWRRPAGENVRVLPSVPAVVAAGSVPAFLPARSWPFNHSL
jgi:hypothetical protein